MQYNPYAPPKRIRYSGIEVRHLGMAVVGLTLAFAFVLEETATDDYAGRIVQVFTDPVLMVGSFLAMASGFILHELAHKVVAKSYGHWAEFRAQPVALAVSLLIAFFAKFLFAAPGAVQIMGRVTPRQNGLISLAGPGVNYVIFGLAAIPLLPWFIPVQPGALHEILYIVMFANGILAAFNLLPVGPLDGRKVWYWNKGIWVACFATAALSSFLGVVLLEP